MNGRTIPAAVGAPVRRLPAAPKELNMDLMTPERIKAAIDEGWDDMLSGNVADAADVFTAFLEAHR